MAVSNALTSKIKEKRALIKNLEQEMHKVVVGQSKMINRLLIGLFTNGHVLLEGVPGLAKTLTVSTLARVLNLDFQRIQFTPDLLPADLIGTMIYNQSQSAFEVKKGPIFANIVLADEINRSPAKVQSALLEAMQEKQVTIGEDTFRLDLPFLVLATQNPVEQEGTYPLPEAQVDRFMMRVFIDYPTRDEEKEIMRRMASTGSKPTVNAVLSKDEVFEIRSLIDEVHLSDALEEYIIDLVMATRDPGSWGLGKVGEYVEFGASPRASIALNMGARALAFMRGRGHVLPEDVKDIAPDVLNHRIILNYEAEADEVSTTWVVEQLLGKIELSK